MAFDVSQSPYNDEFDISKKWEMLLFNPNRPLLQRELNESQSVINNQISLLGNSVFKEGSIISGMGLVAKGTDDSGGGTTPNDANPNFISLSTITSVNSKLDTSSYKNGGTVGVSTTATVSSDYPGVQFQVSNGGETSFTLSFTIKRDSGTLYKFYGQYDSSLTVTTYTIDGQSIKNTFNDASSTLLVDSQGNQINLNDGNTHTVIVTFTGSKNSPNIISLIANPGYNAIQTGNVNFTISALKAEKGDTPTPWVLAQGDDDVSTGNERNQIIQIMDGYIYLNGAVRKFENQTIDITGVGQETIGVKLNESVVTATDDPSLVDHTSGAASQWQQGADRLTYDVQLAYNDPDAVSVYQLKDGKISNTTSQPDYSTLNDVLAKRTDDQSGSFTTTGYSLYSQKDPTDSSVVDVFVEPGTAYVKGYQIIKTSSTKIEIPKATGTADETDEVFIYANSNPSNGVLSNQPIKSVNQVSGNVQFTKKSVTRGATTAAIDSIDPAGSIYQIDKVYSYDSSNKETDYAPGSDYSLSNQSGIQWVDGGSAPSAGSTYYVDYKQEVVFKEGADFQVTTSGSGDNVTSIVNFAGMTGVKPINGSQVHVSYTYFLARVDAITLNKSGDFVVITGQQNKLSLIQAPSQIDPNTLEIGYVTVFPNSDTAIVQQSTIFRIPFTGLQDMATRISALEYNASQLQMQQNATDNQDPTTLRGIFSDDFSNVLNSDTGNDDFTATILPTTGVITLKPEASGTISPELEAGTSSIAQWSHDITAPYTETPMVQQNFATGTQIVNSWNVFNITGTLAIDPQELIWTKPESSTITSTSSTHVNAVGNYGSVYDQLRSNGWYQTYWDPNHGRFAFGTDRFEKDTTKKYVTNTVVDYMEPQKIHFVAKNLMPNSSNLVMTFDNQKVAITPDNGWSAGADDGSIRSNDRGIAQGTFTIPDGVRTGTREVALTNGNTQAITNYYQSGTIKTTVTDNVREYTDVYFYDPLAQSFAIPRTGVLSSIDVYFSAAPDKTSNSSQSGITLQVSKMSDDGFPTRIIESEVTLYPEDVKTSTDGSVATNFHLPDPLSVTAGESYAFKLITDDDTYAVYTATAGQSRIDGSQSAIGQPYIGGEMFTSSNAQTWSEEQNTDIKFSINQANFSDKGIVEFEPIEPSGQVYTDGTGTPILDDNGKQINMDINTISLLLQFLTPDNTNLSWDMKLVTVDQPSNITVDDVDWQPIYPVTAIELSNSIRQLQLRGTFTTTGTNSPSFGLDSLSLGIFLNGTQGTWLSNNQDETDNQFNHIRFQYEGTIPDGATVTPSYSLDGGKTWAKFTDNSSTRINTTPISNTEVRYVYDIQLHDVTSGDIATEAQVKFKLDMGTSSGFIIPFIDEVNASMTLQDSYEANTAGWQNPTNSSTSTTTIAPTTSTTSTTTSK